MQQEVARVFISHGKANRRRRDAGAVRRLFGKLGMGRQRRAANDRVRLAQADHMAERGRQVVEESLERLSGDSGAVKIYRKQRSRQTEEQ